MNPKVSIVTSVYNGQFHLEETIKSILSQTFFDFEFIIIDDASTDKTKDILQTFSIKDPRIRIIKNEKNLGLTKSLNIGLKTSKGEYIARIDSGDLSDPNRLNTQVKFLDENKGHVLIGTWTRVIDDNDEVLGEMKYPTESERLKKALINHNPIVHSSIMFRKYIAQEAGFYNEDFKYAQDYEFYFRISSLGKIANIPEFLTFYRKTPNSITGKKNKSQTLFAIKARISAIKRGQYGIFSYMYLIKPFVGYVLSYDTKNKLKNLLK